jgi:hypothetical protein
MVESGGEILQSKLYVRTAAGYPVLFGGTIRPGDVYTGSTNSFPAETLRFTYDDALHRSVNMKSFDAAIGFTVPLSIMFGIVALLIGQPFWYVALAAGLAAVFHVVYVIHLFHRFRTQHPIAGVLWTTLERGDETYEFHDGQWTIPATAANQSPSTRPFMGPPTFTGFKPPIPKRRKRPPTKG